MWKPIACCMLLALGLSGILGCAPTFAPPMRSTHYGAPGRLAPGDGEVAVSGSVYQNGAITGGIPLSRNLRLEIGSDAGFGSGRWTLGVAGLRWTLPIGSQASTGDEPSASYQRKGPYLDVEGGFGLGVGGELSDEGEGLHALSEVGNPWDRFAGGIYAGAGLGYWVVDWFALFGRVRLQIAAASQIPETLWGSSAFGIEFRYSAVSLYLATGVGGYSNRKDQEFGVLGEGGLSISF